MSHRHTRGKEAAGRAPALGSLEFSAPPAHARTHALHQLSCSRGCLAAGGPSSSSSSSSGDSDEGGPCCPLLEAATAPAPALWLGDTGSILTELLLRAAEGVATERIGTPLAEVAKDSVPLQTKPWEMSGADRGQFPKPGQQFPPPPPPPTLSISLPLK